MSQRVPSEPEELLRRLALEEVPGSPDDAAPDRRDRLIRGMKGVVERSAEQAEKRRRLRRFAYGFAAAAGFALLSGLALQQRLVPEAPVSIAEVERVHGTVVLTQDGAGQVIGGGELAMHDGDAVQTAAGARARLATAKSAVNIGESTELRLSRPSTAEERISLRRGRVEVAVDKSVEAKRAVVVETPDAEVVVRGTVFDVRVEPSSGATITHVHVSQGSVWVLARGVQVALLSAGQAWSSTGGLASVGASQSTPAPAVALLRAASAAPPSSVSSRQAAASVATPTVRGTAVTRKTGTLSDENRLFAAGVDARNRGDAVRAAELFGELLGSYPNSALREAAQVERFRALSSAGMRAKAAGEARRYLAEHGDGFAKSEARDLALDAEK